jgi:hypothetical protein
MIDPHHQICRIRNQRPHGMGPRTVVSSPGPASFSGPSGLNAMDKSENEGDKGPSPAVFLSPIDAAHLSQSGPSPRGEAGHVSIILPRGLHAPLITHRVLCGSPEAEIAVRWRGATDSYRGNPQRGQQEARPCPRPQKAQNSLKGAGDNARRKTGQPMK